MTIHIGQGLTEWLHAEAERRGVPVAVVMAEAVRRPVEWREGEARTPRGKIDHGTAARWLAVVVGVLIFW